MIRNYTKIQLIIQRKIITIVYIAALFVFVFFNVVFAQEDNDYLKDMVNPKAGLSLDISSITYSYNRDYKGLPAYDALGAPIYSVTRSGFDQSYFGENVMLLLRYKDGKSITMTAGVFGGLIYGDDDLFEPVLPVLSLHYEPDNSFYITFGTLDRTKHVMIDALFDDALNYPRPPGENIQFRRLPIINSAEVPRPLENGFEIYSALLRPLTFQGWINWNYINTPADRESFDSAAVLLIDLKSKTGLVINGDWRYIHRGGQLFNYGQLMDGHVFDAGFTYNPTFFPDIKLEANLLWSHDIANRFDPTFTLNGYGQEVRLDYNLKGIDLYTTYWNGRNFYTEDGNPFYQSSNFVNIGLNKKFDIGDGINIGIGVTVYFIDNKIANSEKIFLNFDKIYKLL